MKYVRKVLPKGSKARQKVEVVMLRDKYHKTMLSLKPVMKKRDGVLKKPDLYPHKQRQKLAAVDKNVAVKVEEIEKIKLMIELRQGKVPRKKGYSGLFMNARRIVDGEI